MAAPVDGFKAREAVQDLAEAIAASILPALATAVVEQITQALIESQSRARMPAYSGEAGS